jgi:hypothetical protein
METSQQDQSSMLAVFSQHSAAGNIIKELRKLGFDTANLSLVGRDGHSLDRVTGFYTSGDQLRYWGKMGSFWSGLWGFRAGAAFMFIPEIGPVIFAGPVVNWLVSALEGAVCIGGVSVLGAGLVSFGVPRDKVLKYETCVKAGKLLLIAHGTGEEIRKARSFLEATEAEEVNTHAMPPEPARVA